MTRLTIAVVLLASSLAAQAQTQAEIAEQENKDGKDLMFKASSEIKDHPEQASADYKAATQKLRDAADRAPEEKYFHNLCVCLYQQGVFGDALTACNNAEKLNPTDKQKDALTDIEAKIKADAAAQHVDLTPTGGGGGPTNLDSGVQPTVGNPPPLTGGNPPPDGGNPPPPTGGNPPPNGQYQYAVGRPSQDLLAVSAPRRHYVWALGFDVFGGGGRIGEANAYATSTEGVRAKADYLIAPHIGVGLEGYVQFQQFGQGADPTPYATSLSVFDVGLGAYKHLCTLYSRLCITPLAALQVSLLSPEGDTNGEGEQLFNYAAIGGRFEVALQYAFGPRLMHALSLFGGVNVYSAAFATNSNATDAMNVKLDAAGLTGYVGIGYTFRFDSLGFGPLVVLQ